jgi:hypothetical protein
VPSYSFLLDIIFTLPKQKKVKAKSNYLNIVDNYKEITEFRIQGSTDLAIPEGYLKSSMHR